MTRPAVPHGTSYPRFLLYSIKQATDGTLLFYAWMTLLTALTLVGVNAWATQVAEGMIVTHMTDHVSWGLYIANFTFAVGIAAGSVMMVILGYLYRDQEMHDIVIIGELLAIAAIVACLLFVMVDIGRPDRFWHMIPGIGRFHWPLSILTWDVIALGGYLVINLHICGYMLYARFQGRAPSTWLYVPFVFISIFWAISIHTVTAFLYCGLGGRPFWNSALLAPRFLASAFVSGPALVILALQFVRRLTPFQISNRPIKTLLDIIKVAILFNLFMLGSELFTEFYTGGAHTASARYLYFGLHGKSALVPWIWTSVALNLIAATIFLWPRTKRLWVVDVGCVCCLAGIWIEKGMGLIIPGFIPSTLHEMVEYMPSLLEWKVVVGIWALGAMIYTVGLKIAIPVLLAPGPATADPSIRG